MTITDYVSRLLAHAGVQDPQIEQQETDEEVVLQIKVSEEEVGMLIGYHGENLAAIQRLVRIVFKDELEKRLVVNVNDYRERRLEKLAEMATNAAEKVLATGEPYVFPYLPANERFIIHTAIAENERYSELESVSDGEGKERRLMIKLKD